MEKFIESVSGGLKCDNPKCDWKDETVSIEKLSEWINAKCPKCGENVLTYEDFQNAQKLLQMAAFINQLSPDEIKSLNESLGITDEVVAEKLNELSDGQEIDPEKPVVFQFNTHKTIDLIKVKQ